MVECLSVTDDSINVFFTGQGGAVITAMTLLVFVIITGYISFSKNCGPDNPSNRRHFFVTILIQAIAVAGVAVHLFNIDQVVVRLLLSFNYDGNVKGIFFLYIKTVLCSGYNSLELFGGLFLRVPRDILHEPSRLLPYASRCRPHMYLHCRPGERF